MDKKLQNYADLGKDLMKKDGLWDSALSDLEDKMDLDDKDDTLDSEASDSDDKKDSSHDEGAEDKSKPKASKWIFIGLALLAAMTIAFFMLGKQEKMAPAPMAYYEAIPTSLVPNVRDAEGTSKTDLQKAVIAYGDKDYKEAEVLLTPLANADNDDLAKLYLASIYITQEKDKEATLLLDEIRNIDLKDYVLWNKAISLLSLNPEKAESLFQEIANDTNHFRSKKAQEVLKNDFGH